MTVTAGLLLQFVTPRRLPTTQTSLPDLPFTDYGDAVLDQHRSEQSSDSYPRSGHIT